MKNWQSMPTQVIQVHILFNFPRIHILYGFNCVAFCRESEDDKISKHFKIVLSEIFI